MSLRLHNVPDCHPRLLAFIIGLSVYPVLAGDNTSVHSDTITVTANAETAFRSGGDELVPAWLDGHVANGGRLGTLGEQDAGKVPFSVIGYTAKMIEDIQADTLSDVLRNDAGVQTVRGYGNFGESYRIRGFLLDGDDIAYGGLYGVLPRQITSTQLAERIEVFKGSSAFLNGVPPGGTGVGGTVNIEPKRAASDPLNRVTLDYTQRNQPGVALDSGRRFGDDDRFGARINLLHREGEAAIHDQKDRISLVSGGFDYRGERFRASLDGGWQKSTVHHGRIGVATGAITRAPDVPDNRTNYGQPWVYSDLATRCAALRTEYDTVSDWKLYAGIGASNTDESGAYSAPSLLDDGGNARLRRLTSRFIGDSFSGMAGVRGKFETGPLSHSANLGYSGVYRKTRAAYTMAAFQSGQNIYHPVYFPWPATVWSGGDMNDPSQRSRTRSSGVSLSDTLSMLDERVIVVAGLRRQEITVRNYSYQGKEDRKTAFDSTKVTPAWGLLVKPWQHIAFYANHIEALQPGPTASSNAANAGYVTGVVRSKQNEVGIKVDYQRTGGSLALFEIKKPVGMLSDDGWYDLYGEQRNRGMELSLFGEPLFGLRFTGSAQWLVPELIKTAGGENDGNDAVGVPRYQLRLSSEWDVPSVENLTLNAAVLRSGSQYANAANTIKLDAWTRLDIGARYSMKVNDQTLTWHATLENVTDEQYWSSVDDSGFYLTQSDPRTLKLSMSVDF